MLVTSACFLCISERNDLRAAAVILAIAASVGVGVTCARHDDQRRVSVTVGTSVLSMLAWGCVVGMVAAAAIVPWPLAALTVSPVLALIALVVAGVRGGRM